ncbi:MAG: Sb-PDE family phosphodiesterase [Gammaproteobacteria bacterium]|jgi:predicted metal-dependent phosphoesterase TrpH|tara:strand:- start:133 stop:1377 length:1245 start_codon:yes stop_codon:yes gene_type:complete
MKLLIIFFPLIFFSLDFFSHGSVGPGSEEDNPERSIKFPDTENYKTLVSDLHTHSVFSDGHVWPNIRVTEALKDGVDVLAITEHLEYQPHLEDIPHEDRNKAFLEALGAAKGNEILVINGSEITREMPPGHINAVFIKDANKLINIDKSKEKEAQEEIEKRLDQLQGRDRKAINFFALANMWPVERAVEEANNQGAFVFWNHPFWESQKKDGIAELTTMHKMFIEKGQLHGIEVVNGDWYSEEAFKIAIDNNLTLIGTSDVHNLIDWDYSPHKGGHRPVTLIFSDSKDPNDVKEALMDRRTVIWFKNSLFGLKKNMDPLLKASLSIGSASYISDTDILRITLVNESDVKFLLQSKSDFTYTNTEDLIEVPPQSSKYLEVKTITRLSSVELNFEVMNALISPKIYANINLQKQIR